MSHSWKAGTLFIPARSDNEDPQPTTVEHKVYLLGGLNAFCEAGRQRSLPGNAKQLAGTCNRVGCI